MTILATKDSHILIQGMTGKEGQRSTSWMRGYYDTMISCGVTPGKGGNMCLGYPVYDSVAEAMEYDPHINLSLIIVPPLMVLDAALEAMRSGISTLVIITENVPIKDAARIYEYSVEYGCTVIGPASIGIISPQECKIGMIAGPETEKLFTKGPVGIISKSGSMCAETGGLLTHAGIGQSTIVGIGGDVIAGSSFVDILKMFEGDADTEAIVVYGEMGGLYEEQIADAVASGSVTKPIVAYISGLFAEHAPSGLAMGHSGAIVEGGRGLTKHKKAALKQAGVIVAEYHHEIPKYVKEVLS